jgi:TolB-like protein
VKRLAFLIIALFSAGAFAQDLPQIAIYVTGDGDGSRNKTLGRLMLSSLAQSGRYKAVERPGTFFNEMAEYDKSRSGAVDYEHVREIGKRYGAMFICVANVDSAAGANKVSARIINLESLAAVAAGEAEGPLETLADVTEAARLIAAALCADTPVPAAQELPNIAVYVTGDVPDNEKKALGTHMLAALVNSGRYNGIERHVSFLAEIDREIVKQMSGAIDDSQITEVGKQFGVRFICIADITPAYGGFQVSARVVNVETAEVALIGQATSPLKTIDDLTKVSDKVVRKMFGLPEPPEPVDFSSESGFRMSAGGGGFLTSDFGGGLQWANDERVAMPYSGGGMYLYIDAEYAEVFIGYSAGSGKWESADVKNQNNIPEMQRTYLNFGILAKYPFSIMGRAKLFPILGVDYEMSTAASLKSGGDVYAFDGADSRPAANALSALWVKFGFGTDYNLGHTLYLRAELLYGLRTAANRFEKDHANAEKAKYNEDVKTLPGNGITFKTGVGIKF